MSNLIVAIDGPAASGKSTVARGVAKALGCVYVDSGALYRGVAWLAARDAPCEEPGAAAARLLQSLRMEFHLVDGAVRYKMNGIDPGMELRSESVQKTVGGIAAVPEVREWALGHLRDMCRFGDLVVEGRDIGTVVFPGSRFKFYLDADEDERARRRHRETVTQGGADLQAVQESLARRDARDSRRSIAPLKKAGDARVIDTTGMTIDEVVDLILNTVRTGAPEQIPLLYRVCRRIIWLWLKIWLRYDVRHGDRVPTRGGCIVASNHASFLDPVVVGCGMMERHVRFMARETLFEHWLADWWADGVGVVRIDRTRGDVAALKAALNVLCRGGAVCVFPEGTRTTDGLLRVAQGGIGFLMAKARVPVVPAYVAGTFEAYPKGAMLVKPRKVSVVYGEPIMPSELEKFGRGKEAYRLMADFLMSRIASLQRLAKASKNQQICPTPRI